MLMQDSFLIVSNTIPIILPCGTGMFDVLPFFSTLSFYSNYKLNFYYLSVIPEKTIEKNINSS